MRSIELCDSSVPLLKHILQSSGEPIEVRMNGECLETLTYDSATDDQPIDLSRSPRLRQILDETRAEFQQHGGVSLQDVKARVAGTPS